MMNHARGHVAPARRLAISGLCVLFAAVGCGSGPGVIPELPSLGGFESVPLDALKKKLTANAEGFASFVAECDVVIRSPLIRDREVKQIEMQGTIELLKPKKVRLTLRYLDRSRAIELVGDGKNYVVRTPLFANSTPYGGEYGDPIQMSPTRLTFLPEDLADALDLDDLFARKGQVLRAYPGTWYFFGRSFDAAPIIDVAAWHIDSIVTTEVPRPAIKTVNSVAIGRQTQEMLRLDKFRWDGSLRTRIWYAHHRPVRAGPQTNVEVPGEIMICYPEPLEGTVIRIRFRRIKLNVEIDPRRFSLTE